MQYNPEELDEILHIFKAESEEILQELNDGFLALEKNPKDKQPLKKLFQLAHSLKGAARMLGFNSIQDIAHKLEDILSYWKKDGVEIESDNFQQIYDVCDLLLVLVNKSVEKKSNYSDETVDDFIRKLEVFIQSKDVYAEEKSFVLPQNYFLSKSMDINAIILELMFVVDNDQDTIEDLLEIINENLNQLAEIFKNTGCSAVIDKIRFLSLYSKIEKVNSFKTSIFKARVLDLRNEIYVLYQKHNIAIGFPKLPETQVADKDVDEQTEKAHKLKNEMISKFDFVLANLQKIKYEKSSVDIINENLINIISLSANKKIELILNKTIGILKLFMEKDVLIDNDCYMVILQCVYLAKRILLNEKEENLNNLNFLVQRLSVVEDMFNISDIKAKNALTNGENENLLAVQDYANLKKNIKSFDMQEIKTLRVDTVKVDNLISQTGELLINGIKTREHLVELARINSKLVNLSSVSKKVINYLKYLEKKGFFNNEFDEAASAFYKKTQSFFNDNANMINELNNDFNKLYNIISEDDNKLHQTVLEIESIAKGIRVLPLATIFHSFPRMIRDIAKEKNKKIDFVVSGSDTTVDKKIIEEIKMPLIHIIRNSVSHGIEDSEIRVKNNKSETGTIRLVAKQAENSVVISIEDDGYGINLEKVKNTAIEKGLLTIDEVENMSHEQLLKLLFLPGFSTEDSISEISGRGIGLDIVKSKITNLNGEIYIDSELNKGCKVTIKLPVSMSTIKTFVMNIDNQKYAIPVNSIKYVKQISADEIYFKNGQNCILYDNHSIPVYSLADVLEINNSNIFDGKFLTVIIIENQERQAAFIVDKLLGDQEVFQKKLVPPILNIRNISGFTTLSTGEICLIINPYELIRNTVLSQYTSLLNIQTMYVEDKTNKLKDKRMVLLNGNTKKHCDIRNSLMKISDYITEFDSINSVYDYILKNKTDILICSIDDNVDEIARLVKYIKSDEVYSDIKLVVITDMTEFEVKDILQDYNYNLFQKLSTYNEVEFINKLADL